MRFTGPLFIAALLLTGCKKDDVDIGQLNTNPFDTDYVGLPLFEVDHTFTDSYVNTLGATVPRFNVVGFARTDRIPANASYFIWFRTSGGTDWTGPVNPSQLFGGEFTLRYDNYVSGAIYCTDCAIGTNNAPGGLSTLCATAP